MDELAVPIGGGGDASSESRTDELDELGRELLESTARLVEIPSVSFHEQAIADVLEEQLSGFDHLRVGAVTTTSSRSLSSTDRKESSSLAISTPCRGTRRATRS